MGKRRIWRRGERTCTPFSYGGDSKAVCISPPLEREKTEERERNIDRRETKEIN